MDLLEGQKVYGPRFKNYETFTKKHLWKMTLEQCTPFHDGPVFFTAHAAFDMEMEQALQSINPSISLPYWDYTIDEEKYGTEWMVKSEIWHWFGNLTATNADRVLDTSRFAFTPVPTDTGNPERNSYGEASPHVTDRCSVQATDLAMIRFPRTSDRGAQQRPNEIRDSGQ